MQLDSTIRQRLAELAQTAETLNNARSRSYDGSDRIDSGQVKGWGVSVLDLLQRAFGEDSEHYKRFDTEFKRFHGYSHHFDPLMGIFRSAQNDYLKGYIFTAKALIQAEVFEDFLEQAEHLLSHSYFQAAAVIAGAVLEDGLRQLCDRNSVAVAANPKIDAMNADLTKAGVYNVLVQKQVTALADLRNKAAHGRYTEFSKPDVESMIPQVRTFLATHL